MDKVYIGKIVNTHGIKGELRIKSNLTIEQKREIFKINTNLIVNDKKYVITGYRTHKDFDMVTFDGYNNINDVLHLKGNNVYKEKKEINLSKENILDSELMEFKVITIDNKEGIIKDIEITGNNYKIIRVLIDDKEYLVPYHKDFIIDIDIEKKEVTLKLL